MGILRKKNGMGVFLSVGLVIGLCTAVSAEAELRSMDDSSMADITGKAGLTMEIDLEVNISEIAYHDNGYLAIEDFTWGGVDRTGTAGVTGKFENWKMVIDVANGSESLAYGFSELDRYYQQAASPDAAWDAAILANDDEQIYGDGDLVFHNTSTQLFDGTRYDRVNDTDVPLPGEPSTMPSNSFAEAIEDWRNSAPFGIKIGAVKLHGSAYEIGSKTNGETVLMSDFNAEVLTGPLDIVIQNNGGGSTNGEPDSKVTVSDYFEISDLSMNFDYLGISITGLRLHNRRGDTTGLNNNSGVDGIAGTSDDTAVESFGFAHAKWYLARAPVSTEGLQIAGAIKGDLDISRVAIGDNGNAIGSFYLTDMTFQSSMNVSGH